MPTAIAALGAWLKSKLGTVLGAALLYVVEKMWPKVEAWFNKILENHARKDRQEKAIKEIEQDRAGEKARDDETRRREKDYLNS